MARSADNRPIRRRRPTRPPKHRILVVCEGRVTERHYLRDFQHEVRNLRVHVEIAKETGVPLTVVQEAVRLRMEAAEEAVRERDENLRFDDVWAVFDVDEHPKLQEAKGLAQQESVRVAISNPSFELWALLHFQDQRAHVSRDRLRGMLQEHLPEYEKELSFSAIHPGYSKAVQRARALASDAELHGSPGRNPTTQVYELTELIRQT